MAYSTVDDLKNYLPESILIQLTDDNDTGAIDNEKLVDAVRRADDYIDGHLRGRYDLPLTTVPAMIKDLGTKLASYFLYKRSLILTMPEPITQDYKDCSTVLIKIQQGKINPFPVLDEPIFFATNKTAADNVTATITNNWEQYLI